MEWCALLPSCTHPRPLGLGHEAYSYSYIAFPQAVLLGSRLALDRLSSLVSTRRLYCVEHDTDVVMCDVLLLCATVDLCSFGVQYGGRRAVQPHPAARRSAFHRARCAALRCAAIACSARTLAHFELSYEQQSAILLCSSLLSSSSSLISIPHQWTLYSVCLLCAAEAAEIVFQIASAIRFLHKNFVAHRDLKPENLLYSKSGSDGARSHHSSFAYE